MVNEYFRSILKIRLGGISLFRLYFISIHFFLVSLMVILLYYYPLVVKKDFSKLTLMEKNSLIDEFLQGKINGTNYDSCQICNLTRQLRNYTPECKSIVVNLEERLQVCQEEIRYSKKLLDSGRFCHNENYDEIDEHGEKIYSNPSHPSVEDGLENMLSSSQIELKLIKQFLLDHDKKAETKNRFEAYSKNNRTLDDNSLNDQ